MSRLLPILCALATLLAVVVAAPRHLQTADSSLNDIIATDDDLATLETAIDAAVLNTRICPIGNCTVFAPTNSAFAECVDSAILIKLLTPPYILHLQEVLFMHFSQPTVDRVLSSDITDGMTIEMKSGEVTEAVVESGSITITTPGTVSDKDANVTIPADYVATNGNLHKIDCVLLPSFVDYTLQQLVAVADGFSILAEFIELTGIGGAIPGDFTFFAPTDSAFEALGNETLNILRDNPTTLVPILSNHVVLAPILPSVFLGDGQIIETVGGLQVVVSLDVNSIKLNNAEVLIPDILASNGIAYAIDQVLGVDIPAPLPTTSLAPAVAPTAAPAVAPTAAPAVAPVGTSVPFIGPVLPPVAPVTSPVVPVTSPVRTPTAPMPGDNQNPNPEPEPQPNPKPAPHPAPTPRNNPHPNPKPAPHPSPTPRNNPHPNPQPAPQPHPKPAPHPAPTPRNNPHPNPQPAPQPHPKPAPHPAPTPRNNPHPNPKPAPHPAPTPRNDPSLSPSPSPSPSPQPAPQPHPKPAPHPAPTPRNNPAPNPKPAPHPAPTPRNNPHPNPQPAPQPNPKPAPHPAPTPRNNPAPNPQPAPHPAPMPRSNPHPNPQPAPQPNPKPAPHPAPTPRNNPAPNPQPAPHPAPKPAPHPAPSPVSHPSPNVISTESAPFASQVKRD